MNYLGPSARGGGWFPNPVVTGQPTGAGTNFPYGPMTLEDASMFYWKVLTWTATWTLTVTGPAAIVSETTQTLARGWGTDPYYDTYGAHYPLQNPLDLLLPCGAAFLATDDGGNTNGFQQFMLAHGMFTSVWGTYSGCGTGYSWGGYNGSGAAGGSWGTVFSGTPFGNDFPPTVSGFQFARDSAGKFWLAAFNSLTDSMSKWNGIGCWDSAGNTLSIFAVTGSVQTSNSVTLTLPSGTVLTGLPLSYTVANTGYSGTMALAVALTPAATF